VHQVGEVLAIHRPELQRAPVQHDARRQLLPAGTAGQQPRQRDLAVLQHVRVVDVELGRHVLDRELHAGQLLGVPPLQALHGVQHQIVEDLRLGPGQRHGGRHQPAAQAAAVPIAPGRTSRSRGARGPARVGGAAAVGTGGHA
jgi:hypothetical protein